MIITCVLFAVVQETVGLFQINARQAALGIEIRDHLGAEEKLWKGYPGYLSQIIMNLLTNIERYAYPEGTGGKVKVEIWADGEGQEPPFVLCVKDFGRGIPQESFSQIFEPFVTTGRDKGGTGLGLAIVYNLVTEALGCTGPAAAAERPGRRAA